MGLLALFWIAVAVGIGISQHSLVAGLLGGGLFSLAFAGGAFIADAGEGIPAGSLGPSLRHTIASLVAAMIVFLAAAGVVALLSLSSTVPLILSFAAALAAGLVGLFGLVR